MKLLILLLFPSLLLYPQTTEIFPPGVMPVKIFSGGYFTEGPAYGPDGCIYFSDQTFTDETNMDAGIIWKYDPAKDTTVVFRSPSGMSNGIAFDKEGRMVVCEGADFGGRMIIRTDMHSGKSKIIAGLYNGKPFNSPNDLTIDSKGRIYFTDPRYTGHETVDQPVMGVYRIDSNKKVKLIINNIPMPNGIALSPDEKILYVGCNYEGDKNNKPVMAVYKFNLIDEDSVLFDKKLIEFESEAGPDGIKVSKDGNLFIAVRDENKPQIRVYSPTGELLDSLNLPEVPGNLTFTPGEKELYITAGGGLYQVKLIEF
ncbi:MAG TPA: SMP-30/gluconolactonase/LRE family protein [Ignavibacteriaceae bacterium]|nr:SMP-30/gluconolactonase/LRE family protein [Ignavibacteriaceae bacterium]